MTFFERSQSFPPILVRLLARHKGGRPLTEKEIAFGIDRNHFVWWYSQHTDWKLINLPDALEFMRGCQIDFCNTAQMRRVDDYLRKEPNLEYLRKSPEWDNYYKPLLIRWRSSYPTIPDNIHKPVRDLLVRLTPILKVKV